MSFSLTTMHFRLSLFFAIHIISSSLLVSGFTHPITIQGNHFIDAITNETFFIKGVDYQPGGSSAVCEESDPLSNPAICARDVALFQELGINTIRVYSVNPELDHNACMTMLALSDIYLILDVNSPLPNQHLNRYEPWTTYNDQYLQHVFKVIEQFSYYNNTLGFFAGNEVINDGLSAERSPAYVRSVISDMKRYIKKHSPRIIPVGYSAADDLRYRIPLSYYLGCHDDEKPDSNVDFYGVNSYQWCGEQTFTSSGYDQLVAAYQQYSKPVFFSEFGCNNVLPRTFSEVDALYSEEMIPVFSGGLVYEFTQEPNNYGLVEIDSSGEVHLLDDFQVLKAKYAQINSTVLHNLALGSLPNPNLMKRTTSCENKYENLRTEINVPDTFAFNLIEKGVDVRQGKYLDLPSNDLTSKFRVYNTGGDLHEGIKEIKPTKTTDIPTKPLHEDSKPSGVNPNRSVLAFKRKPVLECCFLAYVLLEFTYQIACLIYS